MNSFVSSNSAKFPAFLASALLVACGCSQKDFPVAPVSGVVLCNGKPLTWGIINVVPSPTEDQIMVGKSGSGVIGPDGRFSISTYSPGDGAVVGRLEVQVLPDAERGAYDKLPCETMRGYFIEVKPGNNEITIDLSASKK